jgi:hypothetical protein
MQSQFDCLDVIVLEFGILGKNSIPFSDWVYTRLESMFGLFFHHGQRPLLRQPLSAVATHRRVMVPLLDLCVPLGPITSEGGKARCSLAKGC